MHWGPALLLVVAASIANGQGTAPGAAAVANADDGPFAIAPLRLDDSVMCAPVDRAQYLQTEPAADNSSDGELAKKLSNPVAALISVPLQSNFDFNAGQHDDRFRYVLNVQPVVPVVLNDDWNLIIRAIQPVIYQEPLIPGQETNFGLGDFNPTLFFSPRQPIHGWIIGAGPAFLFPTATDTALGTGKWGIGPSVVALQQNGPWTYGLLFNHIWSYAGDSDRPEVNQTFLQPFLAYNTKSGFGITAQAESSYYWNQHQWNIPIGIFVSQVLRIDKQAVSISAGPRYYAARSPGGATWGFRFTMTFLFPQK
jgi:hypothetical protein